MSDRQFAILSGYGKEREKCNARLCDVLSENCISTSREKYRQHVSDMKVWIEYKK